MIVLLKASFRKLNMQHENFKGELINKIIKEKIKKIIMKKENHKRSKAFHHAAFVKEQIIQRRIAGIVEK